MARSKSTALGICISCTFGFAFLEGIIPGVAQGPIGLAMLGIAVVSGVAALFAGRNKLGNAIKLVCAIGLSAVIGYGVGAAPSNPLAQQVMGEQLEGVVTSLGKSMPAATVQQASTSVPAATASTMMLPTPMPAPETKQVLADAARPADAPVLTATVFNGGNIRQQPVDGTVIDQINAHEQVQLLKKNRDGSWFYVTNIRGVSGWASKTLLTLDVEVVTHVPIE